LHLDHSITSLHRLTLPGPMLRLYVWRVRPPQGEQPSGPFDSDARKAVKVFLAACARKVLTILKAMMKDSQDYLKQPA
jgi:hypothetical protein